MNVSAINQATSFGKAKTSIREQREAAKKAKSQHFSEIDKAKNAKNAAQAQGVTPAEAMKAQVTAHVDNKAVTDAVQQQRKATGEKLAELKSQLKAAQEAGDTEAIEAIKAQFAEVKQQGTQAVQNVRPALVQEAQQAAEAAAAPAKELSILEQAKAEVNLARKELKEARLTGSAEDVSAAKKLYNEANAYYHGLLNQKDSVINEAGQQVKEATRTGDAQGRFAAQDLLNSAKAGSDEIVEPFIKKQAEKVARQTRYNAASAQSASANQALKEAKAAYQRAVASGNEEYIKAARNALNQAKKDAYRAKGDAIALSSDPFKKLRESQIAPSAAAEEAQQAAKGRGLKMFNPETAAAGAKGAAGSAAEEVKTAVTNAANSAKGEVKKSGNKVAVAIAAIATAAVAAGAGVYAYAKHKEANDAA